MTAGLPTSDHRRRASALLDQQLWCWGRDVARPAGNLLLALGMCRYRAPDPARGVSAYTGRTDGGTVWLWGFGVLYADDVTGSGVFLRRYRFDPQLVPRAPAVPVHRLADLKGLTRPSSAKGRALARTLVHKAAGWMARYEHWVAETHGIAYRRATLDARDRPPVVPAEKMASAWERVAKKVTRLDGAAAGRPGAWAGLLTGLRRAALREGERPNRSMWATDHTGSRAT